MLSPPLVNPANAGRFTHGGGGVVAAVHAGQKLHQAREVDQRLRSSLPGRNGSDLDPTTQCVLGNRHASSLERWTASRMVRTSLIGSPPFSPLQAPNDDQNPPLLVRWQFPPQFAGEVPVIAPNVAISHRYTPVCFAASRIFTFFIISPPKLEKVVDFLPCKPYYIKCKQQKQP